MKDENNGELNDGLPVPFTGHRNRKLMRGKRNKEERRGALSISLSLRLSPSLSIYQ